MIYKFDNGGIVKLQNAGNVPEYGDIEQIAKYNREHGTNFYKMSQVLEHDKQQALQKSQNKKSFWEILAGHPESSGEAILNKTIETANNAELPETRSKIYNDTGKSQLATTAGSLLTLPMLGEFSTYGLLGGTSRLAGGMTGSTVGSYTLGKAGELGDRTFGTTWMKPAGQIIGGFAGWGPGSDIAWKGAAKIAPNRIIGDFIGRSLNKSVSNTNLGISDLQRNIEAGKIGWTPSTTKTLWHNSNEPLSQLKINFPAWDVTERKAPLGHVWLTGNETTQGFLAKRPHHLKGKVELNKPMVQIGEAIGDGKNTTRNQILDFAQKSSADGINFQGIADNTLQNQDVYAVFKDVNIKPKLTEAERLGIPKSRRSNPKALEDPYYWGYKQWNSRYNSAVESGNIEEAQRLRDLHFKIKAFNNQFINTDGNPLTLYHGNLASNSKIRSMGLDPYSTYRNSRKSSGYFAVEDPDIAKTYTLMPDSKIYSLYGYSKNPMYIDAKGHSWTNVDAFHSTDDIVNGAFSQGHDAVKINNVVDYGFNTPTNHPRTPFTDYVFTPGHMKLKDAIIRDGLFAKVIPIVKRDNFHNPDIRYKQGGILKAQRGTGLAGIPIIGNLAKKGFELVAKRSNGAQTKSIPTVIGDVITGRDKSFYNINNSNGSNEIDTYLYGKPYNSEFTGDASIGPDYTNYINKNYPNKNIKTYNTHFGDTLYIDDKAKSLVEKQLNTGEVVGGSMGRYAHAPSYIVTTEEGRPYDAGGHLIKFSKDENGNIVANMSDIYDFLPKDFNDKYDQTENPSWTRNFANNIGTPFIVRQNNIPVVFKEIVPEYKTEKQKELGDFLSQWGNIYDLKLPLRLSDEQIDEIFDGRDYGDDILDFMVNKGYIKPMYKSGGVLSAQKGTPGFVTPMTNQFTTKLMEFLEKYRRKVPAPQKAVGPAVWAYNKPSKIADDGGKIS